MLVVKKIRSFFWAMLLVVTVVGIAQAETVNYSEDGIGLVPDNEWTDGEVYTFLGGLTLAPGTYELRFELKGTAWDRASLVWGDFGDKMNVEVLVNGNSVASTTKSDIYGNPVSFSVKLKVDISSETSINLSINSWEEVSYSEEIWRVDSATLRVSTRNAPPVADAGPNQNVLEETTVTLNGSNSSDPDDGIEFYRWKQVAGPSVSLSNPRAIKPTFTSPSVAASKSKSLKFELTVTDYGDLKDTDTTVVNVTGENDPPTADAGPDQNVDEETTVTLNGSNSSDPDDGIEFYRWKQIAGPSVSLSNPEAVQPTFLAPDVGSDGVSFTFELTVTDYGSLQSTDTTIVNVIWLNDPPAANAGVDQTVLEKATVTLDGSNSFDPDDGVASYQWKQVAGPSVTLSDPTDDQPTFEAPSFDDSGNQPLIFELIVTDGSGLQSSDSTTVSVSNFEKDNPGASGGGCFITTAADG
jgi:hypothetical protein